MISGDRRWNPPSPFQFACLRGLHSRLAFEACIRGLHSRLVCKACMQGLHARAGAPRFLNGPHAGGRGQSRASAAARSHRDAAPRKRGAVRDLPRISAIAPAWRNTRTNDVLGAPARARAGRRLSDEETSLRVEPAGARRHAALQASRESRVHGGARRMRRLRRVWSAGREVLFRPQRVRASSLSAHGCPLAHRRSWFQTAA